MSEHSQDDFKWLIEKIKEHYFNCNFGTLSKSDFELLIFKTFIDIKSHNSKEDSLDYYELSKELGITETRFNNLIHKLSLRHLSSDNEDKDWKRTFTNLLGNLKFDHENIRFKLLLTDPVVKAEFRHYIERKNWFDDGSFNNKIIVMQPECLLAVLSDLNDLSIDNILDEPARDAIRDKLSKKDNNGKLINDEFINSLRNCTVSFLLNKIGLSDFSPVFNILLDNLEKKLQLHEKNTAVGVVKIIKSRIGM